MTMMTDKEEKQAMDMDLSDETSPELEYSDDEPNLVPIFLETEEGRQYLKKLSGEILEERDEAWSSCEELREKRKKQWDLFTGKLPERSKEFKDMANVALTVLLESISRLTHRASAELFGDWSEVFSVVPVGPDDIEKAELLTLHQNWQITNKILDFPRQMQRGLLHFYLFGDVMAHSYWDPKRRVNRHEILTMDEFLIPYASVSTMPDLSDCPYRIKIIRMYEHSLEAMRGIWHGVDDVLDRKDPSWLDEPQPELAMANAETVGVSIDEITKAPYTILQYEGWRKLPQRTRQNFIQAYVDNRTGTIMQLTVFEEAPWDEVIRYGTQTEELRVYRNARDEYNVTIDTLFQQHQSIQENPDTSVKDLLSVGPPSAPPPVPPAWMVNPDDNTEEPAPLRREPVHMFSHQVCIESLSGVYGLGYGSIVAPYNVAANLLLCQYIDSASLGNCTPLLITDNVVFKDGYKVGPLAINKVSGLAGQSIGDQILRMNPGQANPQLRELVEMFLSLGQTAVQAPDVLSGEAGKSGETWRGISTRVEQATKQISVTTRQFAWLVEQLGRNNARLNSFFMDDEEIFLVNNHMLGVTTHKIDKKLYQRNYDVKIRSDMKYKSSSQKIMDAEKVLQISMQIPITQQNPAFQYEAMVGFLEAMGKKDLVPFMGPKPPVGTPAAPVPPQGGMPQ